MRIYQWKVHTVPFSFIYIKDHMYVGQIYTSLWVVVSFQMAFMAPGKFKRTPQHVHCVNWYDSMT